MIQLSQTENGLDGVTSLATAVGSRSKGRRRVRWTQQGPRGRRVHSRPSDFRRISFEQVSDRSNEVRTYGQSFSRLSATLKAKDPYTWNHSLRVGAFSSGIARVLGLAGDQIALIRRAGELHDIGKIEVPVELLRKAGQLTFSEYLRVMEHPVIGEGLVKPLVPEGSIITTAVRWHHARFDGQGGPTYMCGEKIPMAARIVSVADAFDAMTSTRPYRIALSLDTALSELNEHSGSQFDPDCVDALRDLYQSHTGAAISRAAIPA